MKEYKLLEKYLKDSEMVTYNRNIKLRMSKELKEKYNMGSYNVYLNVLNKCYTSLRNLTIRYEDNKDPILYIYMVPDENCCEVLNTPVHFSGKKSSAKPVPCYEEDGFKNAFGMSQNIAENKDVTKIRISMLENISHELSHLIGNEFYKTNSLFGEGFAEAVPLYILGFEDMYPEHRTVIENLYNEDVLTANELIKQMEDGSFGQESLTENKNCSFRKSYISSYLFVRGLIEAIEKNFSLSKKDALQKYLDLIKVCCEENKKIEDIIKNMAVEIGLDEESILNSKEMQFKIINDYKEKGLK